MQNYESQERIERFRSRLQQPHQEERGGSWWSRFLSGEGIVKNGLVVSALVALVGSYVQFNAGRQERRLAFIKEDYGAAYSAFQEVLNPFNAMITLQQILFFTFLDTAKQGSAGQTPLLEPPQTDIYDRYKEYIQIRTSTRSNIDILAVKALLHLDWPLQAKEKPATVAINSETLGPYGFDCDKRENIPDSVPTKNKVLSLKHDGESPLEIDWQSANHQAIAVQYCSEYVHRRLLAVRNWAAKKPITITEASQCVQTRTSSIRLALTEQLGRIKAFEQLGIWKMKTMRQEYEKINFMCHLVDVSWWCD